MAVCWPMSDPRIHPSIIGLLGSCPVSLWYAGITLAESCSNIDRDSWRTWGSEGWILDSSETTVFEIGSSTCCCCCCWTGGGGGGGGGGNSRMGSTRITSLLGSEPFPNPDFSPSSVRSTESNGGFFPACSLPNRGNIFLFPSTGGSLGPK